ERVFVFFFQAEDGIRDRTVTGVQTCALPISAAIPHFQRVRPLTTESQLNLVRAYFMAGKSAEALKTATALSTANKRDVQTHFTRSEERRVGKEERTRV